MRIIALSAMLMLVSGAAFAQEGSAPARPAPGAAATPNPNPNAYVIKPGSTITGRGENGFGGGVPVPELYRDNPGNGFYGAYTTGGF